MPQKPSVELQALLNAAVDAILIIDQDGKLEVFNRSAERLFGYGALEVLGENVSVLMTSKDRQQHDAYLRRYQETGVPRIIGTGRDVTARRKDGSVFPAHLSVGEMAGVKPARYVGFIHDLTIQRQAFAAVDRERDRASRYLEAAQTVLVALDTQHRITLINRKGCEILGYEEAALLGTDWLDIVAPQMRSAAEAQFAMFIGQQQPHSPILGEMPVRTASGALRLLSWRTVAISDNVGIVTGVLSSGDDITELRSAEAEAREAHERMMHVSRLATVGEMAAGISHELNQPLAAITTFAQAATRLLCARPEAPEDVVEALKQIAAQALRAGEIIRRLRNLVRNHATQREPTDINQLIDDLGTLTRADARLNDVRIRLQLTPGLPLCELDPIQIQQVLLNLVRNAVQALEVMPKGERDIAISTSSNGDGEVEIRVTDTGLGVSSGMLDRLFHPFATSKADGTGLGLAISRSIVEAHKGELIYRANTPHGACFVCRLPAIEGNAR